jgi:hypothetical protein
MRAWRIAEALGASRHTTVLQRQRDLLGSVGMMLGAAALVAAIAVPFNDAGLVLGVAQMLRGGLTILGADGAGR